MPAVAALVVAVTVLVACASSSPPAHIGTTSGNGVTAGSRIWAFSDDKLVQPVSEYGSELAARKNDLCATAESGTPAVSLSLAISTLEGVLTRAGGPDALARLARTQVGSNPAQAEALAAAEIAKANPGGALAALLIAHQKEPSEPRHLENAGVVAVSIGYPQEGLAMLTAAEGLPATGGPGMGIDRTATMLNNRAYALIRLGLWADAVPLLRTAVGREPLLAEAQRNLAVALLCLGQTQPAGSALRAGLRRNQFRDVGDPSKAQGFDPSQVYDLSHGQPVKLPDLSYPQTLDQAAGAAPKFEAAYHSRAATAQQLLDQAMSSPSTGGPKSSLTTSRISRIFSLAGNVRGSPPVASLFETWQVDIKAMLDFDSQWTNDFGKAVTDCEAKYGNGSTAIDCWNTWCSSAEPARQRLWRPVIMNADKDLRAWADSYSRFATGLAANLKDPQAHQGVVLYAQYWLMSNYALLVLNAWTWTTEVAGDKGTCYDQITDSPAETKDGTQASAVTCSGLIGGANFTLDLEVLSISVSCEEVGIEAEAPGLEGGVAEAGLFSSVSYKFKDGSTTLFAGLYGKTKEIGGLSAGAKGGFYVTCDNQGNVEDVGMRGESSIDQSKGPGSTSASGPDVSWSFVGAAESGQD